MINREVMQDDGLGMYILLAYSKALLPITILVGMAKGISKYVIASAIFGSIVIFSLDGSKVSLFLPLSMLYVGILLRLKLLNPFFLLTPVLLLFTISYIFDYYYDFEVFNYLLVRRIFCIPQLMNYAYIDYFDYNKMLYFSDFPFVSNILYDEFRSKPASYIVGEMYFYWKRPPALLQPFLTIYLHWTLPKTKPNQTILTKNTIFKNHSKFNKLVFS